MILENSTFFYILPAVIFAVVGVMWFVTVWLKSEAVSRLLGMIPIWAVYISFGLLLFAGGLHRILHVRLEGVEMDFSKGREARVLPVGGWNEGGGDPAIYVRGYPAEALEMSYNKDGGMRLKPGPGYRRELLVRSGERLVALESPGVPALVPLQDGDEIVILGQAGGGNVVRKVIGNGLADFTPREGNLRWIGGGASGVAQAPGYPAQILGVQLMGGSIRLVRGPGYSADLRVSVNGRTLNLGQAPEALVPYSPGNTVIEFSMTDPLTGAMVYQDDEVSWKGVVAPIQLRVTSEKVHLAGGNPFDDLFIKGLPGGALQLKATADGLQLFNAKALEGLPGQWLGRPGKSLVFGDQGSPWGGRLAVIKVTNLGLPNQSTTPPTDAPPEVRSPVFAIDCVWEPNAETRLTIPKRRVSLPVVATEVSLFTHLDWRKRVYPLSRLSSRESGLRSCVVYGAEGMGPNEPALLVMEPGVRIKRSGELVPFADPASIGQIKDGGKLEFLQLRTLRQAGPEGKIVSSLQPRESVEPRSISLRKSLSKVGLIPSPRNKNGRAVRVLLSKTEVKAVDMERIQAAVDENEDLGGKVAFGLNDRTQWASLPHQVKFDSVTEWFNEASGEVELNWLEFVIHDDYHRSQMDYGDSFVIGGADRLSLRVDKRTVPWIEIGWLVGAAILTTLGAFRWSRSFAGSALFFGIAYLTGSRLLFGQVASVNYPYDDGILASARWTLVLIPLTVSATLYIGPLLLQGVPGRMVGWFGGRSYRFYTLWAFILLILRLVLLFMGFKEGIAIGGNRLALSMFFVPAFILLFAVGLVNALSDLKTDWSAKRLWLFIAYSAWVLFCQGLSGLAVSDLGTFLYIIPPALILAVSGCWVAWRGIEKGSAAMETWKGIGLWFGGALALIVPLMAITFVLFSPKKIVNVVAPDLEKQLLEQGEVVTDSTLLRILHFADKNYLVNLGTDASEAILQDHAIMENYAHRGIRGEGYLQVNIIPTKRETAMNDNVSAVFIFGQFGALGAAAVCLAYLTILFSSIGGGQTLGDWVARLVGMTFAMTSLYMLASNWGLVPFTGRNMSLLGLNSHGDILESVILLVLLALGRAYGSAASGSIGITGALESK